MLRLTAVSQQLIHSTIPVLCAQFKHADHLLSSWL